MKKIIFSGKHTIDKITNVKKPKRVMNNKINITDDLLDHTRQTEIINSLFLDQEFKEKKWINSEINKKKNSYRQQDIQKERLDDTFITSEGIIEKLVASRLICHYCKQKTSIFYENVREKKQWTLDRIDNDICHSFDNVVISCLECNLKRRRTDYGKFKFTKQLVIKKKDEYTSV